MRVLLVHDYYRQRGGEDVAFEQDVSLLRGAGDDVETYTVHNDQLTGMSLVRSALSTVWNRTCYEEVLVLARKYRPDVVHVHNTFPLASPSVIHAAADAGACVVQTLHNYRLLCPKGTLFRDGRVCELCSGRAFATPALQHACYRDSRAATAAVVATRVVHTAMSTWSRRVSRFVVLTEFARRKLETAGLPAAKMIVRPNFVAARPVPRRHRTGDFLFVGRLSEEKGVATLLDAWRKVDGDKRLRVVGDGPLRGLVRDAVRTLPNVEWLGFQSHGVVAELMESSRALVFPSLWYEGFPMTIVEAMAAGLPVLGSDIGGVREIIVGEGVGELFAPGAPNELARVVSSFGDDPDLGALSLHARAVYERKYSEGPAYENLARVYHSALRCRS